MAEPWWKKRERQIARYIGAERNRCSGSSGRSVDSRSDSTHPMLYVETKCGKQTARVWRAWDDMGTDISREFLSPDAVSLITIKEPGIILTVWHVHGDIPARPVGFRPTYFADKWAIVALWRETAERARAEGKLPVLALVAKGRPGWLWVTDRRGLDMLIEAIRAAKKGAKQ